MKISVVVLLLFLAACQVLIVRTGPAPISFRWGRRFTWTGT